MLTRVFLGKNGTDISAHLLFGEPEARAGRTAFFGPGQLVILMHEVPRFAPIYVFRTLERVSADETVLPGVLPCVRLIATTRRPLAASRFRNMLLQLTKRGAALPALPSAFWEDVAVVLNGRIRGESRLPHLLRRHAVV